MKTIPLIHKYKDNKILYYQAKKIYPDFRRQPYFGVLKLSF